MALERVNVEARPPNWLPLPGAVIEEAPPPVEEDDLFPKGDVISFHPRQGVGFIRSVSGERISFRLDEVELVGPKGHRRYIAEGRRIGYDVARTTDGVRVTKLKVY